VARAKSGFFGGVKVGPLPPGAYKLYVDADDYVRVTFGPFSVAAGETVDAGELRLPPPGFVKVAFSAEPDKSADGLALRLANSEGEVQWTVRLGTEPQYRCLAPPGRHRLHLIHDNVIVVTRDFEVRAGEETMVKMPLDDSGER
jgi:hypothetical protein